MRPWGVTFTVPGKPETKGSARAFVVGKRAIITNDNPKSKAWARVVSAYARAAMGAVAPASGPVRVCVTFYLQRPQSHFKRGLLRPAMPSHVTTRPDVDKLIRCALDALTGICFDDDSQVVELEGRKLYAAGEPRTVISVGAVESIAIGAVAD